MTQTLAGVADTAWVVPGIRRRASTRFVRALDVARSVDAQQLGAATAGPGASRVGRSPPGFVTEARGAGQCAAQVDPAGTLSGPACVALLATQTAPPAMPTLSGRRRRADCERERHEREASHASPTSGPGAPSRVWDNGAMFEEVVEQQEAKRLLSAALAEGPTHAYLFHGPPGVGKWKAALAFAGALLDDPERTKRLAHPDLYALAPLGDQIRIDAVRDLRRDLHMRPFEAARRVYVIRSAHRLNPDAADALLKDLEEPPDYAVIVLVADELGPLPETIRSRCQLVPFRRLSERAVRDWLAHHAVGLDPEQTTALARVAGGRLDRAERLMHEEGARRRSVVLAVARSVYADPDFDPGEAARHLLDLAHERAARARDQVEAELEELALPARELDQRLRRAAFGAEREDVLEALEELGAWYRDLVAVAVGAERAAVNCDRLAELSADASVGRIAAAERAAEILQQTWRDYEELNLHPALALEALFVSLRRELAPSPAAIA